MPAHNVQSIDDVMSKSDVRGFKFRLRSSLDVILQFLHQSLVISFKTPIKSGFEYMINKL